MDSGCMRKFELLFHLLRARSIHPTECQRLCTHGGVAPALRVAVVTVSFEVVCGEDSVKAPGSGRALSSWVKQASSTPILL